MTSFYKTRLKSHQQHLLKYLKYVLNDHLVLALTFILGGLGLYYSNFVKQLTSDFTLGYLIIFGSLLLTLHVGKLATLVKPADSLFLLPKESEMTDYLLASYRHSLGLPFILLSGGVFILSPMMLVLRTNFNLVSLLLVVSTLFLLKLAHLLMLLHQAYQPPSFSANKSYLIWLGASSLLLLCALWQPLWACLLSAVLLAVYFQTAKQQWQRSPVNWEGLIATEQRRLNRIYRFINLFTDVPGVVIPVKRRAYLDPLLKGIPHKQAYTFDYLFTRHFLRGADYGGLVFRLLVIGLLALYYIDNYLLAMGIAGLIIFLIGFQLLPLQQAFGYVSAAQLYPVSSKEQHQALGRLVQKVLLSVTCLFSLMALVIFPDKITALLFALGIIGETLIFTRVYLPKRLQKMAKF